MDICEYDVLTMIDYLKQYTEIPVEKVPINDEKVYSLFVSPEAMNITADEIRNQTGTLSFPELNDNFAQTVLVKTKPKNFSDLVKVYGLLHGTNVWEDNAEHLIDNGICSVSEVIANREDVMIDLSNKGLSLKSAFQIMYMSLRGRFEQLLTDEIRKELFNGCVPEWYINSLCKIRYMFPKAHSVEYMRNIIILGWYKLYFPSEYYSAYFNTYHSNKSIFYLSKEELKKQIDKTHFLDLNFSPEEINKVQNMKIVLEVKARGIKLLLPDSEKSHRTDFLPENDSIRMPLLEMNI